MDNSLRTLQENLALVITKRYQKKGFEVELNSLEHVPLFQHALKGEKKYSILIKNTGLNISIQNYIAISGPLVKSTCKGFFDAGCLPEGYEEESKLSSPRILISYGPQHSIFPEKLSMKLNSHELLDLYGEREKLMDEANRNIESLLEEYRFLRGMSEGFYLSKSLTYTLVMDKGSLIKYLDSGQ